MEQSERKELKKYFSRLGWTLLLSQVIMLLVVYGLEAIQAVVFAWIYPDASAYDINWMIYESGLSLLLGALCSIGPLLLLRLDGLKERFLHEERAVSFQRMMLFFLLVMGLQLVASLLTVPFEWVTYLLGGSFYEASETASAASVTTSMLLYTVLIAPFCEELIYRGFILQYLRPCGKTFAIVVSSVLFGLMHGNVIQLPMAILCGCLFGFVAVEYSLPASMVLHALTNLSVEAVGWVSAVDEMLGNTCNSALTAFGLISLLLTLSLHKADIQAYCMQHHAPEGSLRCFLSAPPVLLLIAYLVILTGMSITPL